MRKEYLVLAEGVVKDDSGSIDLPLGREGGKDPNTALRIVTPDGAPSRTEFEVMRRFRSFTLMHATLVTGRQHQIRVHLQALGHPVVCDKSYGVRKELRLSGVRPLRPGEEDALLLDRQALHSFRVTFPHPATGKRVTVEAPMPGDIRRAVEVMGAFREGQDV